MWVKNKNPNRELNWG